MMGILVHHHVITLVHNIGSLQMQRKVGIRPESMRIITDMPMPLAPWHFIDGHSLVGHDIVAVSVVVVVGFAVVVEVPLLPAQISSGSIWVNIC